MMMISIMMIMMMEITIAAEPLLLFGSAPSWSRAMAICRFAILLSAIHIYSRRSQRKLIVALISQCVKCPRVCECGYNWVSEWVCEWVCDYVWVPAIGSGMKIGAAFGLHFLLHTRLIWIDAVWSQIGQSNRRRSRSSSTSCAWACNKRRRRELCLIYICVSLALLPLLPLVAPFTSDWQMASCSATKISKCCMPQCRRLSAPLCARCDSWQVAHALRSPIEFVSQLQFKLVCLFWAFEL